MDWRFTTEDARIKLKSLSHHSNFGRLLDFPGIFRPLRREGVSAQLYAWGY